jgi:hypothetical protein
VEEKYGHRGDGPQTVETSEVTRLVGDLLDLCAVRYLGDG